MFCVAQDVRAAFNKGCDRVYLKIVGMPISSRHYNTQMKLARTREIRPGAGPVVYLPARAGDRPRRFSAAAAARRQAALLAGEKSSPFPRPPPRRIQHPGIRNSKD